MRKRHNWRRNLISVVLFVYLAMLVLPVIPARSAPLAALTESLVAYWKMEEASGTRYDSYGSNHLTDNNTVGQASGQVGNAAHFSRVSGEYLSIDDNPDVSMGDIDFTIAAWVYIDDSVDAAILGKWYVNNPPTNNAEFILHYTASWNRVMRLIVSPDGTSPAQDYVSATSFGPVPVFQWVFVIAWHDSVNNTINIQVNDSAVDSKSYSLGVYDGIAPFEVGSVNTASFLGARVDEVGIWKRVLTSQERTALYNSGTGCTYPFTNCSSGPTGGNILNDGNMEQYPLSSDWTWVEVGTEFGRLRNGIMEYFINGSASCGNGYQAIGRKRTIWPDFGPTPFQYGSIMQNFDWPGGTFNYRYDVRAKADSGSTYLTAYLIENAFSPVYYLIANNQLIQASDTWTTVAGSMTVPQGNYSLVFERGNLGDQYDTIYLDDVAAGDGVQSGACSPTPTPTPTASNTPTVTSTPDLTVTPTPSATATPEAILLSNCGFESGQTGWSFNSSSYVELAGGPVGPQYAVAAGSIPSIYQNFYWSGGILYAQTFGRGKIQVSAYNWSTNTRTDVIKNYLSYSDWTHTQGSVYLPVGSYRIELNRETPGIEAAYDGIALSANGYAGGVCTVMPTAGPTSHVTPTPTITGLPSSTPVPTSTPEPTRTPFGTWTPQPTYTPNPTSTQLPTATLSGPEQTATAQGTSVPTYTPYPTYTPAPGGGLPDIPPPQQPQPAWNADCIRPQSALELAAWVEYNRCVTLSWFSWGPQNTQQWQDLRAQFEGREPMGVIDELGDATQALGYSFGNQDWGATGASCSLDVPDIQAVLADADGILTGEFQFDLNQQPYTSSCQLAIGQYVGPSISSGVCFTVDLLCQRGVLPWLQLLFNGAMVVALLTYITRVWIGKASSG